jgi:hypothetical protein
LDFCPYRLFSGIRDVEGAEQHRNYQKPFHPVVIPSEVEESLILFGLPPDSQRCLDSARHDITPAPEGSPC